MSFRVVYTATSSCMHLPCGYLSTVGSLGSYESASAQKNVKRTQVSKGEKPRLKGRVKKGTGVKKVNMNIFLLFFKDF